MRSIFILLSIACFFIGGTVISGAKGVDVYTFKKERVDQDLDGNRGFLSGQPKDESEKERSSKRTLIGVDIELPALLPGKDEEETEMVEEEQPAPQEESVVEEVVEEKKVEEEEWIK